MAVFIFFLFSFSFRYISFKYTPLYAYISTWIGWLMCFGIVCLVPLDILVSDHASCVDSEGMKKDLIVSFIFSHHFFFITYERVCRGFSLLKGKRKQKNLPRFLPSTWEYLFFTLKTLFFLSVHFFFEFQRWIVVH